MSDGPETRGAQPGTQGVAVEELPLRPNMLLTNARATSSTLASLRAEHCIVARSSFFNGLFHRTNFESCSFVGCELDGTLLENSSLRGVILRNCDVEGLVINGIHVGSLLRLLHGED
jgi:uncharacterized protein YjbI with pentapeptide repeats